MSDESAAIEFGINTPFWRDWLLPRIANRCKGAMRALATAKSGDDDVHRGWFQALEWVMNQPTQALAEARREAEERERETQTVNLDEFRARYGNRSPYPSPAPGELTAESNEEPNA